LAWTTFLLLLEVRLRLLGRLFLEVKEPFRDVIEPDRLEVALNPGFYTKFRMVSTEIRRSPNF